MMTSCAFFTTINIKDEQKKGSEVLVTAQKGLGIISSDLAGLNAVIEKWSDKESKSRLAKLIQSQQNIQQYYVRTKEDFEHSRFKNRTTVKKEDKDFDLVKKERDDFANRFKTLNNQLNTYKADRNALKDYLESKGIHRVDSGKLNGDFIHALNESKSTQLTVKNELMDYNVKMNQATVTPEVAKENKTKMQELVKIVEKIENETFKLQRQHSVMAKEIGNSAVYLTPGMKAHGYPEKIKLHKEAVAKYVEEFKTQAQKIQ